MCIKAESNICVDEHKSDTDSGRSSIHGEVCTKSVENAPLKVNAPSQLRVSRCSRGKLKALSKQQSPLQTHGNVIGGYVNENAKENFTNETKPLSNGGGKLHVTSRKDAILKRRNMHRRNTIDIYQFDGDRKCNDFGMNASKSTNCLDKVGKNSNDDFLSRIDQLNFNGSSMPGMREKSIKND